MDQELTAAGIEVSDRFLMFYIRTADRLQRTASWLESLDGGIEYLRDVIVRDIADKVPHIIRIPRIMLLRKVRPLGASGP